MRSVVLGGNGFIGRNLVEELTEKRHHVTVYDIRPLPEQLRIPMVTYQTGSIHDQRKLAATLAGVETVYHLVSSSAPRASNLEPLNDIAENLQASVALLRLCVESDIKRVVFVSSGGAVYGLPSRHPIPEDHPTNPISSYGIVKLATEKYLHLFHHLYGLEYAILRPSNPYGPYQDPDGPMGVVAVFLGCLARGLPVSIWGSDEVTRDFLYVRDLARALSTAGTTSVPCSICNIGGGRGVTLKELLDLITNLVQVKATVVRKPANAADPPAIILDITRAREVLGWVPSVTLEEGLLETWRWIEQLYLGDELLQ